MSSDDFYYIFKYWPLSSLSSLSSLRVHFLELLAVTRCPGEDTAQPTSPPPGTLRGNLDLDWQLSERMVAGKVLLLITIYGNRIRAELELNIDGSDWVGCAGQMENNKLCRKFLKQQESQNISILTLCFCSKQVLLNIIMSFLFPSRTRSIISPPPPPHSLCFNSKCSCHGQGYQQPAINCQNSPRGFRFQV